ncbi:protein kinase [Kitasatospora sp. NPDC052896]|uniref:protein kinase domain-containing protein n=1 Tax=Kitasatospora sp. NPDC052896 TaxID=3364061 RepID=UPI0037C966C4
MTQPQGTSGRVLAGRYRLDSILGSGGMGTVWRAEDEMLGRIVAVKELRMHGGVDEDEKHRLIVRTLREAKATARIRHAAAVTVFDVVEEDDRPWIVMELVDGRSLAEVIKQDGPVAPSRAAEIALELLGVLGAAHSHGILHRDVKPSNVLIGEDGRVVLTDFGIASVEGDSSVTSTGMLVGAPSYISPERARGQKPGPPADLWSLGGTLYAMVEGKPPYDRGSALATLTAVMTEELPAPANAGPLRPVIEGLLDKDPEQRLDNSTTRSMLKRIIAESTSRAESTTQSAMPARKPAKKTTAEEREQVEPAEPAKEVEPAGGKKPKQLPKVPGLSTVRVGSRLPAPEAATPSPAKEEAPPAAPAGGEPADTGGWTRSETLGAPSRLRLRRRQLLLVVVLLLLIAGLVGLAMASGGKGAGKAAAGPSDPMSLAAQSTPAGAGAASLSPAPSTPAASASAPQGSEASASGPAAAAPASVAASPAVPSGSAVPSGYTLHQDPSGYSIQLPDWLSYQGHTSDSADSSRFTGRDVTLVVEWKSPADASALADWQQEAAGFHASDYQLVQLQAVSGWRWSNAADWEWTFGSGTRQHSLNRGFVTGNGKYGYAIYWTANDSDWNSPDLSQARDTGFATFQPAS